MDKKILDSLTGQFHRVAGFIDLFIETCPDKIWAETSGRFPVWQHVYHAVECMDFFLRSKDEAQPTGLFSQEVQLFKVLPSTPADRKAIAKLAKEKTAYADAYFASLNDTALASIHEGFSSRVNKPTTVAGVITGLIGHYYYHFGHCDAALRANGLEGIF